MSGFSGAREGGSPRVFLTDGEHTSMGSWNLHFGGKKSLLFVSSILFSFLCFLNFPDPSHQKLFPWEHWNVEI